MLRQIPLKSHASKNSLEARARLSDFRYAPRVRQTAFCFPDDPDKSLTDETGTLLYGYDSKHGIDRFPLKVSFGLNGMKPASSVAQKLEEPGIPILTTVSKWDDVTLTLTTFATNRPGKAATTTWSFRFAGIPTRKWKSSP